MQTECYNTIRYCKNPYPDKVNLGYSTMNSRKGIEVKLSNGWFFRKPTHLESIIDDINVTERLSLNVRPERQLIKDLDEYLVQNNVKAFYKVPAEDVEWTMRHETLIMYFQDKISPKTEKELIKLISPYTRESADGTMIGTKLATGIYKEAEPTAEDIAALIKRAEDLDFDPDLVKYLKSSKAGLYNKYGNVNSSPAMVKSVELLLDKLEALKVNV